MIFSFGVTYKTPVREMKLLIEELRKDVNRLSTITDRFSKIGSNPSLVPENLVSVIYESVSYLKTRTSQKIAYSINLPPEASIVVPLNLQLFEWVIENLVKNAVDAMTRQGKIRSSIRSASMNRRSRSSDDSAWRACH